jgi:hypothetical protein
MPPYSTPCGLPAEGLADRSCAQGEEMVGLCEACRYFTHISGCMDPHTPSHGPCATDFVILKLLGSFTLVNLQSVIAIALGWDVGRRPNLAGQI